MNGLQKAFFKYTGLNITGMVGLSCYILADTFFVAKALGTVGLAALNFAISVYTFMNGIGLMVGIGGATEFSIKKGMGKNGDYIFMQSLLIGGVFAVLLVITGLFFSTPLSALLGADSDALPLTDLYIKMICLFSPFYILNNILIAFIRNDSNPNLSMIAMLMSSFSNIVLDYIFMFPLAMGMFGAVLATCLSPIISIGVLLQHFIKGKNTFRLSKFLLRLSEVKIVMSFGFSTFIGELASSVALIVFNLVLMNIQGNVAVAAYGILANIALVVISIFNGISQGTQPLASSYYGEQSYKKLSRILCYALTASLIFSIVIYAVLLIFTQPIVAVFSGSDALLESLAVSGTRIYFTGIFFAAVNILLASFLSATSKYIPAMIISILRSSVMLVPLVIIFSVLFGITGVWLSYVITELLVCVLSVVFTVNMVRGFNIKTCN